MSLDGTLLCEESRFCPNGDAHIRLLERLLEIENELKEIMTCYVPMENLKKEERLKLLASQDFKCNHCDITFTQKDTIVLDHHHMTGETHGLAHQSCSLNRAKKSKISMFAHNASNYGESSSSSPLKVTKRLLYISLKHIFLQISDLHFMIEALGKVSKNKKDLYTHCLPKNSENYRALTVNSYRFLDSCAFLPHSLDELVNDYKSRTSTRKMTILKQSKLVRNKKKELYEKSNQRRDYCLRKGIFPYEYCKDSSKLYETKLPPKEEFYSSLTEKGISSEQYSHANSFWHLFRCKDLKQYALRYCECDVIQLAEVFLSFRSMIFEWASLDACHYVGLPLLAYDTFLKGIILIFIKFSL